MFERLRALFRQPAPLAVERPGAPPEGPPEGAAAESVLGEFLTSIRERPNDEVAFLVLADWLEEMGGPNDALLGELIRVGWRANCLPSWDLRCLPLEIEEVNLSRRIGGGWFGPQLALLREQRVEHWFSAGLLYLSPPLQALRDLKTRFQSSWRWVGGLSLLVSGWLGLRELLTELEELAPGERILWLDLNQALPTSEFLLSAAALAELASSPALSSLSYLGPGEAIGDEGLSALLLSRHLARLSELDLAQGSLGHEGVAKLAACSTLPALRILNLEGNPILDIGARALASSPLLRGLERLLLGQTALGSDGVEALVGSSPLEKLSLLDLSSNHLGAPAAHALANTPYLPNLTALSLWGTDLDDRDVTILASSHLARLESLDLGANLIRDRGVRELATSPGFAGLISLNLTSNDVGARGTAILAAAHVLPKLEALGLAHNSIGNRGARALARSPLLARLRALDLSGNRIGEEGARALLEAPELERLAYLNLSDNELGEDLLAAFRTRLGERFEFEEEDDGMDDDTE